MHLTYFVCNFFQIKINATIKQEDVYLYHAQVNSWSNHPPETPLGICLTVHRGWKFACHIYVHGGRVLL